MNDDESLRDILGTLDAPRAGDGRRSHRRRGLVLDVSVAVIAVMATIAVVVLALIMKFEADQARWEQRQTCLTWYRLQADYGLGPWYDKLPAAAADCGGGSAPNGDPLVPGGTGSAVDPSARPRTSTGPAGPAGPSGSTPRTVAPAAPPGSVPGSPPSVVTSSSAPLPFPPGPAR